MMEDKPKIPLEETLLPALLQCFGIIFLGYMLGKVKILGQKEAKGLAIFVQYLALPALIFSTVSTIPFTEMKWEFVASVFAAKACIFICVALISILLTHPLHLGKAGIYAIAATQSNDFALGFPLLVSLYQNTHPEYTMYLYIIAPIQLLLLNGIGFFLLEIEKHNQNRCPWKRCHAFHILKETFKNPVVIMTIVGLVWNVTYGQRILPILDTILKAFSSAFPATALLLLGYTMNLSSGNSSHISVSVALIILAKNLVLPIILQKITTLLLQGSTSQEIQSFSSFGFLYGTIPTAPTVYVFATHYDSCMGIIAKTVIGSTLLSAPLMFSSASVISLTQIGVENLSYYLNLTISYLSLINAFCCIWLLILFCMGKRWRSVSFGVTIYMAFAQFLTSVGGIMLFSSPTMGTMFFYIQYILTSGSIYVTRLCTVLLASLLLVIRVRSLCFILHMKKKINVLSILICLILPYVVAVSLIFITDEVKTYGFNYQLGYIQVLTTFVLTLLTLSGTIICLVMQRIYSKKSVQISLQKEIPYQNSEKAITPTCSGSSAVNCTNSCYDIEDLGRNLGNENEHLIDEIEDHVCDSNYPCSVARRFDCSIQVSRYINENQEIGTGIYDNGHFLQHIGLLIAVCVAMTLSLSVCLWKIIMEEINGIFIELEFLDVIVNYSLGIFFFIMFGFDRNLLYIICEKWNSWCGRLLPTEPTHCTKDSDTSRQFLIHCYKRCKKDLPKVKVINNIEYRNIFETDRFLQWIAKENLAQTEEEADSFLKCLLIDHVIEKVYEKNNFSKGLSFLRFTEVNLSLEEVSQTL